MKHHDEEDKKLRSNQNETPAKQALDRLVARLKVDEDGDVEERVSGKKIVAREDWQRVVLE